MWKNEILKSDKVRLLLINAGVVLFALCWLSTDLFSQTQAANNSLSPELALSSAEKGSLIQAELICRIIERRAEYNLKSVFLDDVIEWTESTKHLFAGCKFSKYFQGKSADNQSSGQFDEVRVFIPASPYYIRYIFNADLSETNGKIISEQVIGGSTKRHIVYTGEDQKIYNPQEAKKDIKKHGKKQIDNVPMVGKGGICKLIDCLSYFPVDEDRKKALRKRWVGITPMIRESKFSESQKKAVLKVYSAGRKIFNENKICYFDGPVIGESNYLLAFIHEGALVLDRKIAEDDSFLLENVLYRLFLNYLQTQKKDVGLDDADLFVAGNDRSVSFDKIVEKYILSKFQYHMNPGAGISFPEYDRLLSFRVENNVLEMFIGWARSPWKKPSTRPAITGYEEELTEGQYAGFPSLILNGQPYVRVMLDLKTLQVTLVMPTFRRGKRDKSIPLSAKYAFVECLEDGTYIIIFKNVFRFSLPKNAEVAYKITYKPWGEGDEIMREGLKLTGGMYRNSWLSVKNQFGEAEIERITQKSLRDGFGKTEAWENITQFQKELRKTFKSSEQIISDLVNMRNALLYDLETLLSYPGYKKSEDSDYNISNLKFELDALILGAGERTRENITINLDALRDKNLFDEFVNEVREAIKRDPYFVEHEPTIQFTAFIERDDDDPQVMRINLRCFLTNINTDKRQRTPPIAPGNNLAYTCELLTRKCIPYFQKKTYEIVLISYDSSRLSQDQIDSIKEYRRLLIRALKCDKSNIKLEPFKVKKKSARPLISVYRYNSLDFHRREGGGFSLGYGTIEVSYGVNPEDMPVAPMLNIALAVSFIPIGDRLSKKEYDFLSDIIKRQYYYLTGKMLNMPSEYSSNSGVFDAIRQIRLRDIKPHKTDYFVLEKAAIISA